MNVSCTYCGSDTERSHRFCSCCGSELQLANVCRSCGTLIQDDHRFCFECGTRRSVNEADQSINNDSQDQPPGKPSSIAVAAAGLSGTTTQRPASRRRPMELRHQPSRPYQAADQPSISLSLIPEVWQASVKRTSRFLFDARANFFPLLFSNTKNIRLVVAKAQNHSSVWEFDEFAKFPDRTRLTIEVAAVVAVSIVALYLRVYDLGNLPLGFELNESGLSIDALRVFNGEWIGAWSPVHGGQPTGFSYWTALWFTVGEPNIFWARFASVVPGVAIVPVAYVLLRTQFPFRISILAIAFLAFSVWFIIPSRMGVQMMLAVFLGLTSMLLALKAGQSRQLATGIAAGVVLGLSIYSFKAFLPYFVGIWGCIALLTLFSSQHRKAGIFWFLIASVAVAFPVLNVFTFTGFVESELAKDYYGNANLWDFPRYLPRIVELLLFVNNPISSGTWDGTGGSPLLHTWVMRVFFWFGLGVAVLNINRRPYQLLLIGWLIAASAAISVEGAESRRYLFAIFFILTIMAIGFNVFAQIFIQNARSILGLKRPFANARRFSITVGAVMILVFSAHVYLADRIEFNKWSGGAVRWFFEADLFDALKLVDNSGVSYRVVSFNGRTRIADERVGFLYPNLETIEGAAEHGGSGQVHAGLVDGNTAFVLFGNYMELIDELEILFPGQVRVDRYNRELGSPDNNRVYIAYLVRDR